MIPSFDFQPYNIHTYNFTQYAGLLLYLSYTLTIEYVYVTIFTTRMVTTTTYWSCFSIIFVPQLIYSTVVCEKTVKCFVTSKQQMTTRAQKPTLNVFIFGLRVRQWKLITKESAELNRRNVQLNIATYTVQKKQDETLDRECENIFELDICWFWNISNRRRALLIF